jgi:Holliday junction resolvase
MVDSRQKGARAEAALKKLLRDKTGINFQRTPGSGALNETHKLKGDIYIPNAANTYCIEVKHYKDDHLTSKVLTSKNPQLIEWWKQAVRQGIQVDMEPILFFKFDRSKWFVATYLTMEVENEIIINYGTHNFSIYNVDDINLMEINWILKAQEA